MRKISIFTIILVLFCLCSCSTNPARILEFQPRDKQITEVFSGRGEDFVYFVPKKELRNVTVNIMNYNSDTDDYTLVDTVFEKDLLSTDVALKLILEINKELPYVMINYYVGDKEFNQYVYKNPEDGKLLLLER